MKSCNRAIVSVLVLFAGCGAETPDLTTAVIQDVGLVQGAGVPPLGEGVAPIAGRGGDGVPVVMQVGGWTGGPGAVKWHGGQWVVPYEVHPGAVLQNVSCDIWNPTTAAPANVFVEVVSSNGQVLGSSPPLPPSTSVVFRAWPFIGAHAVTDGEQVVVRISSKDATTGAWTSAAQDTTVIGCAANATLGQSQIAGLQTIQIPVSGPGLSAWQAGLGTISDNVYALPLHNSDQIVGLRARVRDALGLTFRLSLQAVNDGAASAVASGSTSAGTAAAQTLSLSGTITVASGTNYQAAIARVAGSGLASVYWIEADVITQ